jgi:trans-aconitate methyltransferase
VVKLDGMWIENDDDLARFYEKRLLERGFSSDTMMYRVAERHTEKMDTFASVLSEVEPIQSLLEIGCGYGALLDSYTVRNSYIGLDLVPAFIAQARRKHPKLQFHVMNAMEYHVPASTVCLAGVLSSVPEPEVLFKHACGLALDWCVFDVTVADRIEPKFENLHRWTDTEMRNMVHMAGFAVTDVRDLSRSWVLVRAMRRRR